MFSVGDYVVYGNIGVCQVESISPAPLPELSPDKDYYTLMPVFGSVRIYVPTTSKLSMRAVMEPPLVEALFARFGQLRAPIISTSNSTELASEYRKLMGSHDCESLMILIKSIRKKIKKAEDEGRRTGLTDSRFLKQAEDLLFGEFSIALNQEREQIEARFEEIWLACDPNRIDEPEPAPKTRKSKSKKAKATEPKPETEEADSSSKKSSKRKASKAKVAEEATPSDELIALDLLDDEEAVETLMAFDSLDTCPEDEA